MINLQVRTEAGEIVSRGRCGLDWMTSLRGIDDEEFPLLGSILPYADTMFNARQTERLRREIASHSIGEVLGRDSVAEIERLCLQVEHGSHLYLWFVGD